MRERGGGDSGWMLMQQLVGRVTCSEREGGIQRITFYQHVHILLAFLLYKNIKFKMLFKVGNNKTNKQTKNKLKKNNNNNNNNKQTINW